MGGGLLLGFTARGDLAFFPGGFAGCGGMETVLVFGDAFAEGIAVNAEGGGSLGEVVAFPFDDVEDELFFELLDCFFEEDAAGDHFIDEGFEFCFHQKIPPEKKSGPVIDGAAAEDIGERRRLRTAR